MCEKKVENVKTVIHFVYNNQSFYWKNDKIHKIILKNRHNQIQYEQYDGKGFASRRIYKGYYKEYLDEG